MAAVGAGVTRFRPADEVFGCLDAGGFAEYAAVPEDALAPKPSRDNLASIGELLESGRVVPVIDRRFSLGDVPAALRYLEHGRARGKVVIGDIATHHTSPRLQWRVARYGIALHVTEPRPRVVRPERSWPGAG